MIEKLRRSLPTRSAGARPEFETAHYAGRGLSDYAGRGPQVDGGYRAPGLGNNSTLRLPGFDRSALRSLRDAGRAGRRFYYSAPAHRQDAYCALSEVLDGLP